MISDARDLGVPETKLLVAIKARPDIFPPRPKIHSKYQPPAANVERNEKIRVMALEGKSNLQIAQALGLTKGQVSGAIARLGLCGHRERSEKHGRRWAGRMTGQSNARKPKPKPEPKRKTLRAPVVKVDIDTLEIPDMQGIPHQEIRDGRCKYAINNAKPYLFCGVDTGTQSKVWCPFHRALVFEPFMSKPKRQRRR